MHTQLEVGKVLSEAAQSHGLMLLGGLASPASHSSSSSGGGGMLRLLLWNIAQVFMIWHTLSEQYRLYECRMWNLLFHCPIPLSTTLLVIRCALRDREWKPYLYDTIWLTARHQTLEHSSSPERFAHISVSSSCLKLLGKYEWFLALRNVITCF